MLNFRDDTNEGQFSRPQQSTVVNPVYQGSEETTKKAPMTGRRRSSLKVLLEPTESLDRGWSWVVCIACFFTTFITIGTLASFGVLYVGLLDFYSSSNGTDICSTKNSSTSISAQTAWIGSQASLLTFLLGPLSAVLVARWGVRPVVITGAIFFSSGMFLTASTNQIWQATITYGVMGGLGGALIYTPSVGILPAYFQMRKAFAVSFAQCGGWLGNLAIAAITSNIRDAYGWRKHCLFLGGIGIVMIFLGALFRPRPQQRDAAKQSVKNIIWQSCNSQRHVRFAVWVWLIAFHFFQLYLVLIHLARHAECKFGADRVESSLLLTYLALSAAFFSIVGGLIQDRMKNKILILQFVIFIGGVNNLIFPFLSSYSQLVGFAVVAGVTDSFLAVMSVIPQYLVGIREAVNAFGVLSFTSAVTGALAGPGGGLLEFFDSFVHIIMTSSFFL
jgi:MCP family monocarboxylic acid transporter-like MFS transporter 10